MASPTKSCATRQLHISLELKRSCMSTMCTHLDVQLEPLIITCRDRDARLPTVNSRNFAKPETVRNNWDKIGQVSNGAGPWGLQGSPAHLPSCISMHALPKLKSAGAAWLNCSAGHERKRLVRRVTQHGEFAEFAPNTQNT